MRAKLHHGDQVEIDGKLYRVERCNVPNPFPWTPELVEAFNAIEIERPKTEAGQVGVPWVMP